MNIPLPPCAPIHILKHNIRTHPRLYTAQAWLFAGLLTLSFLLTSCTLPVFATPGPTATPILTSTPTIPPPTPTLTPTPTLIPTPTPVPAARIESGDRALFDGDYDTALQEYIAAGQTSQDPDIQTAALLGMGRVYYLKRDYPRALEALRALVKDYPKSPNLPAAYFCLGQVYEALSRYAEAAEAYQNYLMHRPGLIDAYLYELRGDALINAGNYSGALTDYQASLGSPRAGDTTPLQIKMAHTYAITGDFATAIVMYNDIYNRATDDYTKAQVDLLLGQAYGAIGQTENANKTYLDAVENYPLAYDAYLALVNLVDAGYPVNELERGLVDYYADQYPVALAAFNRYLEAGPADASTARYYKGLTLSAMEDYTGAIEQWDIVIKRFPEAGVWDNAWEMKAYTQWGYLDKYPEAAQTLLDFVASSPSHARAAEFLFDAARVYERSGKLAKAAKTWERVTDEYPASEYAFRSLFLAGISLYRQHDYVAANTDFQRLLGMSDNISQKSTAYFWIGKTLNAQEDKQGARLNWEQAATTDPTGYYSERARDILSNRQPFSPSPNYDLTFDRTTERKEAEAWLRTKFSLPADTNLSDPGPLLGDNRLARGAELWQLGLYPQARDEFENLRLSVENDPANTFRLANYLLDLGLYRSSILAARQVLTLAGMDDAATLNPDVPRYFNHIRFGTYYSNLIIPVAQAYNLPPLFLFSLIRQESFFESFVISPAGARGLMQIMPATAQGIADQLGWPPNFVQSDLFRPKVSITFGIDYLAHQRDYLGSNLYAALAAYNGGPGNANEWQGLSGGDPDVLLEIVRFDETHRYITGIYEMFNIYRRLYDRTP